eukprot:TRINITY_DN5547_c0_g1_i1.p2 TRINITY_DN5547_c0_g1~~TRINITY_DN5547_c0_g1_i1.p2  ORF type:complete len:366 (+),score=55.59 TRINITY_DN5547_c0_g1_i1:92-1189(+)
MASPQAAQHHQRPASPPAGGAVQPQQLQDRDALLAFLAARVAQLEARLDQRDAAGGVVGVDTDQPGPGGVGQGAGAEPAAVRSPERTAAPSRSPGPPAPHAGPAAPASPGSPAAPASPESPAAPAAAGSPAAPGAAPVAGCRAAAAEGTQGGKHTERELRLAYDFFRGLGQGLGHSVAIASDATASETRRSRAAAAVVRRLGGLWKDLADRGCVGPCGRTRRAPDAQRVHHAAQRADGRGGRTPGSGSAWTPPPPAPHWRIGGAPGPAAAPWTPQLGWPASGVALPPGLLAAPVNAAWGPPAGILPQPPPAAALPVPMGMAPAAGPPVSTRTALGEPPPLLPFGPADADEHLAPAAARGRGGRGY